MDFSQQSDVITPSIRNSPIDGQVFKKMIEAALSWLRVNHQLVNALNVFPVPDGDTGTNMVLTMQAAYDEISNSGEPNVGKIAHAVAHGALMGARGNSGVILSQLLRGFARALDSQDLLDGPSLVRAFVMGRDTAYKGVVRPVEGTILTVAKDAASAAELALINTQDPCEIFDQVVPAADQSVQRTPELLAVLKEAGVVDAGGKGFYFILDGISRYINGLSLDVSATLVQPLSNMILENTRESIEPGQDWEVVVDFSPTKPLDIPAFYHDLEQMGTSIQVGEGEGMYRMHIHVPEEKRNEPVEYTLRLGTVHKLSMENLVAQMAALGKSRETPLEFETVREGEIAVVAVSPGPGLARIFANLHVSAIVEGGQTMNPSTQEIISAFEKLPTKKIIVLPNNKNIILTAKSAAELTDCEVRVIETRSIPQGLEAMLRYVADGDLDEVFDEMSAVAADVVSGEITTATRSVELNGVPVNEGEFIALLNGNLVHAASKLKDALFGFLDKAEVENYELVTLFYGADLTKPEVDSLAEAIQPVYPNLEIEIHEGGQPHYQLIISIV